MFTDSNKELYTVQFALEARHLVLRVLPKGPSEGYRIKRQRPIMQQALRQHQEFRSLGLFGLGQAPFKGSKGQPV